MEQVVKIDVPEGMELDLLGCEFAFKPTHITYEKIEASIVENFEINKIRCHNRHQADKIDAMIKLLNVAIYLNKGWVPDFDNDNSKWFLALSGKGEISIKATYNLNSNIVYFKEYALAKQAIDILGDDLIRTAFI